jgi:hypothetical protein
MLEEGAKRMYKFQNPDFTENLFESDPYNTGINTNIPLSGVPIKPDFSTIPLSSSIWPGYNTETNGIPLTTDMYTSYDMGTSTPIGYDYTSYDMGIMPNLNASSYGIGTTPTFDSYSYWDMGGIQLPRDEDYGMPELAEIEDDDVPELVPADDYIREMLENEDEDVKELAKKYKINNKSDIEKIKELIKRQNLIKQFEYKGETIQYKSVEPQKEKLNFGEYTAIGPTKQFQDSSNSEQGKPVSDIISKGFGLYSAVKAAASSAASSGVKFGGAIDTDLLETISTILSKFITLGVVNGKFIFLIKEDLNPEIIKIIQTTSILSSISFLENYKKIQLLNGNKLSYENINNYLNECYSELKKFINIKGGNKKILVKTKKYNKKKYLKTYKRKNTKKTNKKTKKRKLIMKKKLTRKH